MEKDLISVIVIAYNVESYLRECIESVLRQTYNNLEVILVDDGSTDGSSQICDYYAKEDSRVSVIHKKNGGQYQARKSGTLLARGEFLAYVDGDDWIEPCMYEKLHKYIVEKDVCVVESGVIDSNGDSHIKRTPFLKSDIYKGDKFAEEVATRLVYSGTFFSHGVSAYIWSKLWRKDAILPFQLDQEDSDNLLDDVLVVFPAILSSESLYVTDDCYYHYRVRMDSSVRKERKDIEKIVFSDSGMWIDKFKKANEKYLLDIGEQLDYFKINLLIEKGISAFDDRQKNEFLSLYGGVQESSKIILYGAGSTGIHLKKYCDEFEDSNIVFWADKNYMQFPEEMGVGNPEDIKSIEYDYIVIAITSSVVVEKIKEWLLENGVPKDRILWINQDFLKEPGKTLERIRNRRS